MRIAYIGTNARMFELTARVRPSSVSLTPLRNAGSHPAPESLLAKHELLIFDFGLDPRRNRPPKSRG